MIYKQHQSILSFSESYKIRNISYIPNFRSYNMENCIPFLPCCVWLYYFSGHSDYSPNSDFSLLNPTTVWHNLNIPVIVDLFNNLYSKNHIAGNQTVIYSFVQVSVRFLKFPITFPIPVQILFSVLVQYTVSVLVPVTIKLK